MSDTAPSCTVYYDGSCPMCRAEISVYQRAEGAEGIHFEDVSAASFTSPELTREKAMARFHMRDANGVLQSGARAFIALWLSLPRWRWLGRIASIPPIPSLLEIAYRVFLPLRPTLQRLARGMGAPPG
jgi:predicted DCC family thiol-disulfide oxidoreductase YuxK